MANYVKFMRGTPNAYKALSVKDSNTLYFISETDADVGRLYLGDKEIICENNQQTAQYLSDLLDVALPENVGELLDGQVLTYDVASDKWVARSPETVAQVVFDENQFVTDEEGKLSLLDFASAPNGAQLTKGADGSLMWVLPDTNTVEGLGTAVESLRTDVDNLTAKFDDYDTSSEVDSKIATALAGVDHLSYQIVNSTDEIDLASTNVIYLVANGDVYDEYMVINGKLEKVGDWAVDLSNYATKAEVNTKVEDLASQLNTKVEEVETTVLNISTRVENLENANSTITDLTDELNAVKETVAGHTVTIGELQSTLDDKLDKSVYDAKMEEVDADLGELKEAMTWNDLAEPIE